MGYKTNIYANKHFSSVSFVTKLIAVEGAYLNQHFGASCKLQNVKRSPIIDQVKSREEVDSKKWIHLCVCLLAGKKSFLIKSLAGEEKELIDQQRHLNRHRKV